MGDDVRRDSELDASLLDDQADREELRDRYYGLLQELRVVVTGVQVLLAFLLTAPFATRFGELDESGQAWFGAALACATMSVIAFVTPTAMHRFGDRTARAERLELSILVTRIGLFFLGLAMLLSFGVVAGFIFSGPVAGALITAMAVAMLGLWVVAPLAVRRDPVTVSEVAGVVAVVLVIAAAGRKAKVTKEVLFVNDSVTHESVLEIVDSFNLVEKDDVAGRYAPNYWTEHMTSLLDHVKFDDGTHLNAVGQQQYAAWLHAQLDARYESG